MNESDRVAIISRYLDEVREQFESGHAIEHAYRPALKALMSSFEDTVAVNDPKHSEHGAPDFIFLKKSNNKIIKGYAEAKDIIVSLDKTEKSDQMKRYAGYANLFLTDYLEFRFFRNGEKYETISLGHVKDGALILTPENGLRLAHELAAFLEQSPESIRSGKRLAQIMGGKARRIRDNVIEYLTSDDINSDELNKIYEMMKQLLVHDLEPNKFADMYAQTLVYGLFVARYGDNTPESFTRSEARDLVPKSNPFLQHFFDHIVGPNFDTRLSYIVDELCEIFSVSDVQQIVHKHLRIIDETKDAKDPIIHFYEDFLQEYDPKIRKDMGAYYTPTPVVKFIVRHVDKILKEDFGIAKGLASDETFTKQVDIGQEVSVVKAGNTRASKTSVVDKTFHKVQILDPAVGTATFLNETIKFIYEQFKGQEGRWPSYVADNLVPRLYGFELMMAPYTIAHLKLGMTLKETGVENLSDRLGVYLTNTLEEGVPRQQDLFSFGLAQAVSEESQHAAEIKSERPIMIVMGNPPYSVSSNNKSEYIQNLIADYKKDLNERKINLDDDYIKFIRFSEEMIAKNGSGIVAMITNNSYIDGITHRQMRKHLLQTFDKIYVLDLHGNAKKQEAAPDGSKDENVFDIMQGVSIIMAVKSGAESSSISKVYHYDIFGLRKHKFEELGKEGITFNEIAPIAPNYFFVPKDFSESDSYKQFIAVDSLLPAYNSGIQTKRDKFVYGFNSNQVQAVHDDMKSLSVEDLRMKYHLPEDGRDWSVADAKNDALKSTGKIASVLYHPFDIRETWYSGKTKGMMAYPRYPLMRNMLSDNVALISIRNSRRGNPNCHFISNILIDKDAISPFDNSRFFPLYIYHDDGTRTPNFNATELSSLFRNMPYTLEDLHDYTIPASSPDTVTPEDVFDYIYAVLHSPSYREKYKVFLKIDFPRVPAPEDAIAFWEKAKLGRMLRHLHLMHSSVNSGPSLPNNLADFPEAIKAWKDANPVSPDINAYETTYPVAGNNAVENIVWIPNQVGDDETSKGRVYVNEAQYFGNVPELAWSFYIGGYQPAQKWLKDRKGRALSNDDLDHYQKIIKILLETDRIMKQIG